MWLGVSMTNELSVDTEVIENRVNSRIDSLNTAAGYPIWDKDVY
jgi:hypothetical protein